MNTGERIALLQKELEFEDERQEVRYAEFQKLGDLGSDELEKILSTGNRQETKSNLCILLRSLKKTNNIVERIIENTKKAKK